VQLFLTQAKIAKYKNGMKKNKKIIITLVLIFFTSLLTTLALFNILPKEPAPPDTAPVNQNGNITEEVPFDELSEEARVYIEGESHQKKLEAQNELLPLLPYRGPDRKYEIFYKITDEDAFKVAYPIILHPNLLPGDEEYEDELTSLRQDALRWIGEQIGLGVNDIEIEWRIE